MESNKPGKFRIWLSPPDLAGDEGKMLTEALRQNWIASGGPYSEKFEKSVADFTGAKYALAVNSGTSAIHLALLSLNIGQEDEVICPSFTFAASVFPILYQKAVPVFIDSEKDSWNISPEQAEEAIIHRLKKGKRVKAILVVHIYGQPAQMDKLLDLGERFGIPVIEDAAQALGSVYKTRKAGSLAKAGIFSFNGNKIITTSGGGMLVSDDSSVISKGRFLANQASSGFQYFHHEATGYNYRMSDLLAAIGIKQMGVLEDRVDKKRGIFERYRKDLTPSGLVSLQPELPETFSNRWLTSILFDKTSPIKREDIYLSLKEAGIETRYLMQPMHLQPALKQFPFYGNGFCEQLFNTGISLPSGTGLTTGEQDEIIDRINCLLLR